MQETFLIVVRNAFNTVSIILRRHWLPIGCLLAFLGPGISAAGESTWVYAVQIAASVQTSPPQITLTWPDDPAGVIHYTVYRKAKDASAWEIPGTRLPGSATSYTDSDVTVGTAYEYQIVKWTPTYFGYGYICSGIEAPLIDNRGKLILIVADSLAADLATELARLKNDLTGDGWQVIRHDVSTNDSPASVKSLIVNDYYYQGNIQAVFLLGHIPILHSGNLNYDGHQNRPMPADSYYGDVDGDWSGSPGFLPSDVELMVGRVDLFGMPGNGAGSPWPNEVELTRNYLNKDHNWRHGLISVPPRALMGDRRGADEGYAPASSAYRSFDPLLGHDAVVQADISDTGPPPSRWISMLAADSYLWAYACGGGAPTSLSHMGNHGQYFDAWSLDVVAGDAKAVFVMALGSWFGNWDSTDNFMRSFLATPTMGLTCCLSGLPHWFAHHMGLGEPIGYSTRVTMNNSTLYRSQTNFFTRAVYIALMGDPTLRMYPVAPPAQLTAVSDVNGVTLNWWSAPVSVVGYHVYRAESSESPFTRLTSTPTTETQFIDSSPPSGDCTYMVRAIRLETTASGTFLNPSQGIFASVTAVAPAPIQLHLAPSPWGYELWWNTEPGRVYRLWTADDPAAGGWQDLSGEIYAWDVTVWWIDFDQERTRRFYRVTCP